MTRYFFEGLIESGQTATIMTQDGRFGELDLVHYVLKYADIDLDNPTEAQSERAARLADPPTRNLLYFPFGRDIAQSTARIGKTVSVVGEPQPFVILSPANRHKAELVRKKIFNMDQWWRASGPTNSLLHISEGLDKRFAGDVLTLRRLPKSVARDHQGQRENAAQRQPSTRRAEAAVDRPAQTDARRRDQRTSVADPA